MTCQNKEVHPATNDGTASLPRPKSDAPTATRVSGEIVQQLREEQARNRQLLEIVTTLLPRYGNRWNLHSLSTLNRQSLSRILYYNELYQKIIDTPGVILEFGVQWGATLAQLVNLRGIYEPFNYSRKIVGFDTFAGFSAVGKEDGDLAAAGDYATMENYRETLERILDLHESFSPISHIKKYELIEGDASTSVDRWLTENPHAIVAMAIFDMDLYKSTKDVLEKILSRLTRGTLLVFDELNCPHFPGETRALAEVIGIGNLRLHHFPHQAYCAWAVFEGVP